MSIDFIKRKTGLFKIKRILKDIQKYQDEVAKDDENFYLMNSKYGKEIFSKLKNPESFEYFYNVFKTYDDKGSIPKDLAEMIEKKIEDPNVVLGIHRTGDGIINPDDIYSSSVLNNILQEGINITGDMSSSAFSKNVIPPNKNISPINDMLHAVIFLKNPYKNSTGGILVELPVEAVDKDLYLKEGGDDIIYKKGIINDSLKPEYILGFVSQKDGICKYSTREEILKNYNQISTGCRK